VVVICEKAFAKKRMVHDNEFRATGSGNILYAKELIDDNTIRLAFSLEDILFTQSIAFDFDIKTIVPYWLNQLWRFSFRV